MSEEQNIHGVTYLEFCGRVHALSERIILAIADSREDLPFGEITAALLETIGYYVGLCPPAAREDLMREFRTHLVDDLESEVELSVMARLMPAAGGDA